MRKCVVVLSLCLLLVPAAAASATDAPMPGPGAADAAPEPPVRDLDAVVVSGVQPGPGLWKVSDGERVLWVLGTVSPLPRGIEWEARDVEAVLAQADELIWPPALAFNAEVGFFGGLRLLPKVLKARRNPDGATLREVLPPGLYARWQPLKRKYLGRGDGVEEWRPLFAAMELYQEAIEDAGLRHGVVTPVLERAAKRYDVTQSRPQLKLVIADPKAALDEFRGTRLDDLECFDRTLRRLEGDLDLMRQRANAWAVGDVGTLRGLPDYDPRETCLLATLETQVVKKRAPGDLKAQLRAQWLQAAERALAHNAVSFAVLPMGEVLRPDGYLAALRAKGYAVEEP